MHENGKGLRHVSANNKGSRFLKGDMLQPIESY
jgi:hypothetical protein